MSESAAFDSHIRRFEDAWKKGKPAEIADFLADADGPGQSGSLRRDLLIELVCIDLEYHWKKRGPDKPPTLDHYVQQFPLLGPLDDLPIDLIGEEYRVRHLWGDVPTHDTFIARFTKQRESIRAMLEHVDLELLGETEDEPTPANVQSLTVRNSARDGACIDAAAPLPYSDYLLQRQIGIGATGKVYQALQKSLDRSVAVKYLRKAFNCQPRAVERFVAEARTVARFQHSGIVTIHGLGRTPIGGYFIVMDLVEGGDLSDRIEAGPVAVADAVRWIAEACDAIQHAHDHGIVHCDLKPSNLLLDRAGHVRVTDFGLARSIVDTSIRPPEIAGTAMYMAPEQVSGYWGSISPRTDLYGLGAVLYVLLTGRPPYDGNRIADILAKVASAQPVSPPRKLRPEMPDALNDICQRCLSKSPEARFATARELHDALGPIRET